MKTSELTAKLAEAMDRYGDVPVKVYNSDFGNEDVPDWDFADIRDIRFEGMEIEIWV